MAAATAKLSALAAKAPKVFLEFAEPRAKLLLKYGKVELVPPTFSEIPEVGRGFQRLLTGFRTGAWRHTTVTDAWRNALITTEVLCWFFVGECIGKRALIGYHV